MLSKTLQYIHSFTSRASQFHFFRSLPRRSKYQASVGTTLNRVDLGVCGLANLAKMAKLSTSPLDNRVCFTLRRHGALLLLLRTASSSGGDFLMRNDGQA